jgi:hypothetical protein
VKVDGFGTPAGNGGMLTLAPGEAEAPPEAEADAEAPALAPPAAAPVAPAAPDAETCGLAEDLAASPAPGAVAGRTQWPPAATGFFFEPKTVTSWTVPQPIRANATTAPSTWNTRRRF